MMIFVIHLMRLYEKLLNDESETIKVTVKLYIFYLFKDTTNYIYSIYKSKLFCSFSHMQML